VSTSANPNVHLKFSFTTKIHKESFSYLEAVGCLIFAPLVNSVEKFTFKPSNIHFILMRRICRYLWGTVHWDLPYHIWAIANILEVCLEIDFTGDPYIESQETVIGFLLQMNGGWISWGSWNQSNMLIDLAKENNGTLDNEYGLKFGNRWISYIGNIMGCWKQELYCEHLGTYIWIRTCSNIKGNT